MRVRLWNAMPIKSFEYFIRSTFPDSLFNRFSLIKCHYDSESSLKWSLTRSRAEKKWHASSVQADSPNSIKN